MLSFAKSNSVQHDFTEVARIEQDCLRWVIRAIFDNGHPRNPDLSFPSRAALVRRAENIMHSRLSDPMGAIDLCAHLGVSDRTLRLAFRERYGMGPMAFYQAIRLNAARDSLQGSREKYTVANAANANGFNHLGNFALAYRRLFGERPSETIRGESRPGM